MEIWIPLKNATKYAIKAYPWCKGKELKLNKQKKSVIFS